MSNDPFAAQRQAMVETQLMERGMPPSTAVEPRIITLAEPTALPSITATRAVNSKMFQTC
jgi:hypothetical protein